MHLGLAIIERAIRDALFADRKAVPDLRLQKEAARWLNLEEVDDLREKTRLGSFKWWCSILGLSDTYITHKIKDMMAAGSMQKFIHRTK